MSLTSPPLVKVNPGDPLTSQQWNNIVGAIGTLYDAFNKVAGSLEVTVKVRGAGTLLKNALVNVLPTGGTQGPPRVAVFVGADVNRYRIDQLPPGTYKVVAQIDGYTDETLPSVTMASDGSSQTLTMEMSPTDVLVSVPNLYGQTLGDAVTLIGKSLPIGRIIDSHGKDIPPGAIPDDAKQGLVLNQAPPPGVLVPKNTGLFLSVSAKAEFTERVKVPDLRGLTIDQARVALQSSQLVLGEAKDFSEVNKPSA
jgi:PASTA domain